MEWRMGGPGRFGGWTDGRMLWCSTRGLHLAIIRLPAALHGGLFPERPNNNHAGVDLGSMCIERQRAIVCNNVNVNVNVVAGGGSVVCM